MKTRMSSHLTVICLCLTAFTLCSSVSAFEPGGKQPGEVLDALGIRGGLVVHVGCEDGSETARWRANERYVVQGLSRDVACVEKARQDIRSLGMYGDVTVARYDGKHLPYTDNLVNLLVVTDKGCGVSDAEIMRVLAPRGAALVNGRKVVKSWPADIDEWTHFLHGPNNNAVARDTQVEPPRHMQWVAGPKWGRSHDHLSTVSTVVSANGRIFYIADEGSTAAVTAPSEWKLTARDAFSGVLLWKREIPKWEYQLRPFRSGPAELPRRLVAVGDRVYVTLGYGEPVTALDAATGETLHTYAGTENTHEIIAEGGRLYLVISEPLKEDSTTTGRVLRHMPVWRGSYLEFVTQYLPKHICVVDADSGELLWRKQDTEVEHILPLTLTVGEGKVFFQNAVDLTALDAASGEVLWRSERPGVRHRYAWLTPTVVVEDGVVLSADRAVDSPVDTEGSDHSQFEWRVSANHILTDGQIMAFSADDGERLWEAPCHEGFNSPVDVFVANGKVWSGILAWGRQPGITKVYDLHTGKVVATRSPDQETYTLGFGHSRCYRHKATTKYVIHGRAGVEFLDMNADRVVADHWVRGACQYGIMPCNGMVYVPTHPCACYITAKLSGFNALVGGERETSKAARAASARLEKGPAYGAVARKYAKANASDGETGFNEARLTTYRGDNARSGCAGSGLSAELQPKWNRRLDGPLTAVVVGGGRVYVAQRDAHTVHALDAGDGSHLWEHTVAGRVDSPPTVYGDLAYFGAADGWMYCVRADDGTLVWRFRVAPEERQIVSYGQLESAWPVHGNVLVCEGPAGSKRPVAYAAAGRSSYVDGGVWLCGVDAVTGKMVVERHINHRDPKTNQEPQNVIRGTNMPGAIPDVLATDGSSLFMRHQRFDFAGGDLEENVDHLFSSAGYLEGSWWHRTYLQIGTDMGTGYGGWGKAGNKRLSGRALVRNAKMAFGFGRKGYSITGSHIGLQSEYHLFGAEIAASQQAGKKKKGSKGPSYVWSRALPFYPRAMLLAGETLFAGGPEEIGDFEASKPQGAVRLWAISTADGEQKAAYRLASAPVYDSFAASRNGLYFATVDGRVVCYQPQ